MVDVPCFTTAVEAAVTRSVTVYPFRWHDARSGEFAKSVPALPAQCGRPSGPSLSPGEHGHSRAESPSRETIAGSAAPGDRARRGTAAESGWRAIPPRWHRAS